MVLQKGLEDWLSGIMGSIIIAELFRNPWAVLLKQVMVALLLDQFGGQDHTTPLVFLVNGNLQEVTAAGIFRTGMLIRYGQFLLKEGPVHMEMLVLAFGVRIMRDSLAVIRE
jgi:hypothetical protein